MMVRVMEKIWNELYDNAKKMLGYREVSNFLNCGGYSCAIYTDDKKIITGISINADTKLSLCAERNAIIKMISQGSNYIDKIVILNELEEVVMPCRECLLYLMQFKKSNSDIEILIDFKNKKVERLSDLLPDWYGTVRLFEGV